MAIASSHTIEKIRDYIKKISTIFSPVFFALAGAQFNIGNFVTSDWMFYIFFIALVLVAVISKMIGCGVPAAFFLKSKSKGVKVGYGMISRGEVGLIVAGVAIQAGAISQGLYSAILGMIMITTIIAPLLLRKAYDSEPPGDEEEAPEYDKSRRDPPDFIPTYPLNLEP
jgi:Kef-type K+ transport system membrane component KefB